LQILPQISERSSEDLIDAVDKCKTNADVKQVGIEWAIQQLTRASWSSCFALLSDG
jgi:methylenetetrahydrofolate reductase (NADPH)